MKYGKEITEELCKWLKIGNNRTDAVTLAGISYETFSRWMEEKSEFSESIKRAEAECKTRHIQNVRKAAFGDGTKPPIWTASAWWLERKHQDEFAIKYKLEHQGKDGGPITAAVNLIRSKLKGLSKDELKKLAKGL